MTALRDMLLSEPVGNINGEPTYRCHWTGEMVKESEMILTPPILPQVLGKHPAAPGYEPARRRSYIDFCEMDANCNTCQNLDRVPHEKQKGGMLFGRCKSVPINHPYPILDGVMTFHPEDFMGMECYESRFASETA